MNIQNLSNINFNAIQKLQSTNMNNKINFKGGVDSIQLSQDAKEKGEIIKNLVNIGYEPQVASKMVNENYKNTDIDMRVCFPSEEPTPVNYDTLVNGDKNGKPVHWVESLDRNLTPTEAVVYMAENMHDYYFQHSEMLEDWDYGADNKANFSPIELAEYMNLGLNIITAGMVLKGNMDLNTAERVSKYYTPGAEKYIEKDMDVCNQEYICENLKDWIDDVELYTSDEKNPDGTLKSGLIRPLTNEEIIRFMYNNDLPWGEQYLNNYLILNRMNGRDIYDLSDADWDSDMTDTATRLVNALQHIANPVFGNVASMVQYTSGKYSQNEYDKEFFEDLKGLDNDKFLERISVDTLKDALVYQDLDRKTRQNNVSALNSASEELLNKMATGSVDEKGEINSLGHLLKVKDLSRRISVLDAIKTIDPKRFENMEQAQVLNYLTNSNYYTVIGQKDMKEYMFTTNPSLYTGPARIAAF